MRDCILVTGGAGFIGSALSSKIRDLGLDVVAVDSFLEQVHPTGNRSEFLDDRVSLVKSDIRDQSVWSDILAEFRPVKIVHLAAETGTAQSLDESTRHASTNVVGTTEMLDALARANVQPHRIVLASSRAVYGEGKWRDVSTGRDFYPKLRTHEMLARSQWTPPGIDGGRAIPLPHDAGSVMAHPASIYGATKLAQEHILECWCGAHSVPLSILRLQNVYGEGQSPYNSYTGIINIFHRIAKARESIPVYEDGLIGRDFVHVDDVAEVFAQVLSDESNVNHKFDVGMGIETTILDAARTIAELHGAVEPHICGKFRDGDIRSAVADVAAMTTTVSFTPKVSFAEGAQRVGDWLSTRGYI